MDNFSMIDPRQKFAGVRSETFEVTARRLLVALSQGGRSEARPDDFRRIVTALAKYASAFGLAGADAEEVAQESVIQAYTRDPGEVKKPGAFLFWTARNRTIDKLRSDRRHAQIEVLAWDVEDAGPTGRYSADDDAIAALLDADATAKVIEHALRAANAAGDALAARAIEAWLELAEELGKAPSSRDVAPRAGVSHTSVNQALRRFRSYIPERP